MTHIFYPHKNWSSIVVEKFHIIYSLKEKLADFAYTYSFNANALFVRPVEQDIIPNASQRLVAALHPSFYKRAGSLPYDKNKESPAYLKQHSNSKYYQSGLMGGETKAFMEMAEVIKTWTDDDLKRNYIPVWHDESYYNKYMSDKSALVLTPNYIWGSYPSFFCNSIIY